MPMRKTSITVASEILEAVDAAARERGESRSCFIARVLGEIAHAQRQLEISRRLDALFEDPAVVAEQQRMTEDGVQMAYRLPSESW
ncbi:MAG: ribbon-helix-helix protein, CopG family [Candidatus Schekmanbacteria bacterium]|nr:ribbon-helix-helix protein, CopG family [Candidatus Schekmanbacteria bacterium]